MKTIYGSIVLAATLIAASVFATAVVPVSGSADTARAAKGAVVSAATFGNEPTVYFPDQFTVKHWDDSPLPSQF